MDITVTIPVTEEKWEILQGIARADIPRWRNQLTVFEFIGHTNHHLLLIGPEPVVQEVQHQIERLLPRICSSRGFIINYPGALSHAENNTEIPNLRSIEANEVVSIKYDENSPTYSQVSSSKEIFTISDKIKIKVQQGRVYSKSADVIVCPTVGNLELCGEVGEGVLKEGGKAVEDECRAHIHRHMNLMSGHVFVSRPGELRRKCRHIFHAVGPDTGSRRCEDTMYALLLRCMTEADNLRATKLALPLAFHCPADKLTEQLLDVVKEVLCRTPATRVKEICIVDMNALRLYQCIRKLTERHPRENLYVALEHGSVAVDGRRPFVYKEEDDSLTTEEQIKVELFIGSICDVQPPVDVIVNSTSQNLNLNMGAISSSIYEKAGPTIQAEVNRRAPGGIQKTGQSVYSEGHNITNTRCVYHCALVPWDGKPDGNSVKVLREAIGGALALAHRENHSSIALPAIGSGILRIPIDIVVDSLVDGANAFSKQYRKTSIKRIVLVGCDKADFITKLRRFFSSHPSPVQHFTEKFAQLKRDAKKFVPVPKWTYTFQPQKYELLLDIHGISEKSLRDAEIELGYLFENAVTSVEILRNNEPCLDNIDNDKARALECLQYTHRVGISLKRSSDKLDSIEIEGFAGDVQQAEQDVITILSMRSDGC